MEVNAQDAAKYSYYLGIAINLLHTKIEAINILKANGYLDPRDVLGELETMYTEIAVNG